MSNTWRYPTSWGALRYAAACGLLATACWSCGGAASLGPWETVQAYAQALRSGDSEAAYALLSAEARKTLTYSAFKKILAENPDEVRAVANALLTEGGHPSATATLTATEGEPLKLVYENDHWTVDPAAIEIYGQSTPDEAIRTFVRAFENGRFDVLMRFVPDAKREGLDAKKLKLAWTGDQKDELERSISALKAAIPGGKLQRLGDRASLRYGTGNTVELLREAGVWKIEEF